MDTTVGTVRVVNNGTVNPYGITRLYAIDFASSISATTISLYNGLDSTSNLMLRVLSDGQGAAHEAWTDGIAFSNGIYLNTNTISSVIVVFGMSRVTA